MCERGNKLIMTEPGRIGAYLPNFQSGIKDIDIIRGDAFFAVRYLCDHHIAPPASSLQETINKGYRLM